MTRFPQHFGKLLVPSAPLEDSCVSSGQGCSSRPKVKPFGSRQKHALVQFFVGCGVSCEST